MKTNNKTYIVTAFRWGHTNEQFTLFASDNLNHCTKVAEYYPDYRGGKYGCAVYCSPTFEEFMADEGEDCGIPVFYSSSLYGESKPSYNHRCDVFNTPICDITRHEEYKKEESNWVKEIIENAEKFADRMNERSKQ